MRLAGSIALGVGWLLLLLIYSAPLWITMFGNWAIWVEGDTAVRDQAAVLLALVLVLPPVALAFVTRWWLRRGRA